MAVVGALRFDTNSALLRVIGRFEFLLLPTGYSAEYREVAAFGEPS
jgi:hypothetical protein